MSSTSQPVRGPFSRKWNSPDSEKNYKEFNSGQLNYNKDEIDYNYNSDGYRCDDFSLHSELPIIFLGCSYTEGEGLPINEVWSYHLHNKIKQLTNKNIPFWSLGKGGSNIDYAARMYYQYAQMLKPKYIFYLLSGIKRREFCLDSPQYQMWFPNHSKLYAPDENFKQVSMIFSDPNFALYQTERSAMILQLMTSIIDSQIFIFDTDPTDFKNKIEFFKKFNRINYYTILNKEWGSTTEIPDIISKRPFLARDNSHPGAVWQYRIYDFIWSHVKDKIG